MHPLCKFQILYPIHVHFNLFVDNEKITSQIVGICEAFDQNGDRVS